MGEGHRLEADAGVPGRERFGVDGVQHGGRVEEQLGELRGLGHGAFQPPVDLVELEHDLGGVGVVGEGDDDLLHPLARAAEGEDDHQAQHVGQDGQGGDQGVDAQVAVVPGPQRQAPGLRDPAAVFGALAPFGRERPDGLHVRETVGDVAGDPGDRRLPVVDEPLPAPDQRGRGRRGQHEHHEQDDDQHRFVAPQHHGPEEQGDEAAHDAVRQRVGEVLEALAVAEHPFGQGAGEVVVEEGGVLGEEFVHAAHVEVFHAEGAHPVQAVLPDPPDGLGEQQRRTEAQHVRQCRAEGETVAGRLSGQLGDQQRGDVADADFAHGRQQQRGQRQAAQSQQFQAVVAQRQDDRAPAGRRSSRFCGPHHTPGGSEAGSLPSNEAHSPGI